MFTRQVQALDSLNQYLPPEAVEIIKNTFAQCAQALEHRGQVKLETDGQRMGYPQRKIPHDCGEVGATLSVRNEASFVSRLPNGTHQINNGYALEICGVLSVMPSNFEVNNEGDDITNINIVTNTILTTNLYVENIYIDYVYYAGGETFFLHYTADDDLDDGTTVATIVLGWPGENPPAPATVTDRHSLFRDALAGAKGIATWDPTSGNYEVLYSQKKARYVIFALSVETTPAAAAPAPSPAIWLAYRVDYWNDQDPGESITVVDWDGLINPNHEVDAPGLAIWDEISQEYRVVTMFNASDRFLCTLKADLVPGDADCDVETLVPLDGGRIITEEDDEIEGVLNTFKLAGLQGDAAIVCRGGVRGRDGIEAVPGSWFLEHVLEEFSFTTPHVLGDDSEGSETALEDSWDRDALPEGTDFLEAWVPFRIVYNHAGDKKLYEFFRKVTIDYRGCIKSISVETRVEVDATELCS